MPLLRSMKDGLRARTSGGVAETYGDAQVMSERQERCAWAAGKAMSLGAFAMIAFGLGWIEIAVLLGTMTAVSIFLWYSWLHIPRALGARKAAMASWFSLFLAALLWSVLRLVEFRGYFAIFGAFILLAMSWWTLRRLVDLGKEIFLLFREDAEPIFAVTEPPVHKLDIVLVGVGDSKQVQIWMQEARHRLREQLANIEGSELPGTCGLPGPRQVVIRAWYGRGDGAGGQGSTSRCVAFFLDKTSLAQIRASHQETSRALRVLEASERHQDSVVPVVAPEAGGMHTAMADIPRMWHTFARLNAFRQAPADGPIAMDYKELAEQLSLLPYRKFREDQIRLLCDHLDIGRLRGKDVPGVLDLVETLIDDYREFRLEHHTFRDAARHLVRCSIARAWAHQVKETLEQRAH